LLLNHQSRGGKMSKKCLVFLFVVFWALPASAELLVHPAWVGVYNGTGNSQDEAHAIAVDDLGNVYVTGQSTGNGTDWDYATVKYYPDGEVAWTARYDGPASLRDIALALDVDGSGNVYVTGHGQGLENNSDILTVKYYPDGDTAWTRRYNGPANSTDAGYDIAVDQYGNAYITGYSVGSSSGKDYLTIKYLTDGTEAWVASYNGPGSGDDNANAIAVDNAGNAYVTGVSDGIGTSSDFATIKYDPAGDELWVERYNGPQGGNDVAYDIALDNSGNVYATGSCYHSDVVSQYATVKYDPSGDELWARVYVDEMIIPPGSVASAITVNGSGNACVTGWSRADETLFDYATVKYNPDGDEVWVARYNSGWDNCEVASAVTVDDLGNVYVTGYSEAVEGEGDDYLTVKYDPDGNQLWKIRYNGAGNYFDGAWAIVVDGSGNVYVTGQASGSGTSYDYATIKYVQYDAIRGDANGDGAVEPGDVVYLVNYLFRGGASPDPLPAGDCNCDGLVEPGDVVYLINYLFRGGPAPSC
jgi:hypothetical protein